MNKLLRILDIQPEERTLTGTLFLFSFEIGLARFFVLTPALALFLERFDAEDLGLVYTLLALPLIVVSTAYVRLGRILPLRTLIVSNLLFVVGLTILIRLALDMDTRWPALLPAVWFYILFTLTSSAFTAAANRVLDIRQGKRLIPLSTTGDVIAFFVGGAATPWLVARMGTANLLLLAATAGLLSLLTFLHLNARYRGRFAPRKSRRPATGEETSRRDWSSPYLRLMAGYFAVSALAYVLIDNAFNAVAEQRYLDTAQLAAFFGTYAAVAAIANFVFKSFVGGRIVRRFGVSGILLGFPLAIGIGSFLVVVGPPMLARGNPLLALALVFWFTTMTRLINKVFLSAQYSTFPTLYQPLDEKATGVQATLEGVVEASAYGLAGLLLLGLHAFFDFGAVQLSVVLIGVCGGWAYIALALRREYTDVLGQALHRRRIGPASISLPDRASLDLVMEQLESPHPESALYALDLLEESYPESVGEILVGLLDHPSTDVRVEALARIEKHHVADAFPKVRALAMNPEVSPVLRGAAARSRWVLSDEDVHEGIMALSDPDSQVRTGTMVGMLRSGSVEGIVYAGHCLLDNLRSSVAEERVFAASVIGESGMESFHRQALELLKDKNTAVRKAIIKSAPRIGHAGLWPFVVEALRDREVAAAASEALVAAGSVVIPSLAAGIRDFSSDRGARLSALRILGLIRGPEAMVELCTFTELRDPDERHAAMSALANCSFEADDSQIPWLKGLLKREGDHAAYRFASIADISVNKSVDLLVGALNYELEAIRHRIFLLLSFIYTQRDVLTAWDNYNSNDRDKKAYALELLENVISTDLKSMLFPVLDDIVQDERLAQLRLLHDAQLLGAPARLKQILSWQQYPISRWTASCARHLAAEYGVETGSPPETIVEQTMRLKSVDLFEEVPEHVLAGIVPELREIRLRQDEMVFAKGDVGDSLYIVIEGSVRMHDESVTVAEVAHDRVFGEMTVLQSAPRTLSATASMPTRLFRFEQDALYRLIADQVGIARSMIQIIIERLRQNQAMRAGAAGD